MAGTGTTSPTSLVDFKATKTYLKTSNGMVAPKTHCLKRIRKWGLDPGYCEVAVKLNTLDTVVPGVAGVISSPAYSMKEQDTAQVLSDVATLFSGVITEITPDISFDHAVVRIEDFKHWLEGVQSIGSWWAQVGTGGSGRDYRQGVKAHFNKGNAPNSQWVDTGDGNFTPMFCPAYYGISRGTGTDPTAGNYAAITIPDPDDTSATDKATYWTPKKILQYYMWATSQTAYNLVKKFFPWYGKCTLPKQITWPTTLATSFADLAKVDRKAFERIYHCTNINAIIDDICKSAGPYALNMIHNDDGSNTMQIVRTRYIGSDASAGLASGGGPNNAALKGVTITRAVGGKATNDMTGPTVIKGQFKESSRNAYSVIIPVGAHPLIEVRCASTLDNSAPTGYVPLLWNYSPNDLTKAQGEFLDQLKATKDNPQNLMRNIIRKYPSLFCEYMVTPGFPFADSTTQGDFPVAQTQRDLVPHCLSSYFPSNAADEFARLNSRYPTPVEISVAADDVSWGTLQDANGLQFKGRGVISFRLLRDQDIESNTLLNSYTGGSTTPAVDAAMKTFDVRFHRATISDPTTTVIDAFQPKRIRITLAIPCDHRLTKAVTTSSNPIDGVTEGQVETDDSDRFNTTNFQRAMAMDVEVAAYEERAGKYGGYPIPQSLTNWSAAAAGKAFPMAGALSADAVALYGPDSVLRDDSSYLQDHANRKLREHGRLDRGGPLFSDRLELSANVGDSADVIHNTTQGDFPAKAVIREIEDNFEEGTTKRHWV